jgi:hypothetical protein
MLLSMLDDYVVMPIPTSHMVSGSIHLDSLMKSRSATWSKVGASDYYGKIATGNSPHFLIRTNFFGTTVANQVYGQLLVCFHAEYQHKKAVLE